MAYLFTTITVHFLFCMYLVCLQQGQSELFENTRMHAFIDEFTGLYFELQKYCMTFINPLLKRYEDLFL